MKVWLFLVIAIVAEVIATSCLKSSEGFTRLLPSLATITGYAIAFFFLSLALKAIPVGIAYAIWSGVGIVLISTIGWLLFKQSLDTPALLGMGLILSGVLIINLFSTSTA
ncbi:QacE family quaternary ammonium compound efflux SMR transporter [Imbroritus primus]|uniref:QacE family quaternary ammonium compound efflux SMR transporter n=1 Tax=Imbroritus primus TaxID=3058603 RepID=A0ACD3SQI7_9BURK|nr:QacE family quaternary ammonium compound efflux SMR transporter [Burkholderiaceae bacterium PBA]